MTLDAAVRVERRGFVLDVDLRVEDGETVAVLGPNGAGKTTLLQALAGLVPLDAGRVRLDDEVLEDTGGRLRRSARHRRVGIVFQDHRLFPHLTARENVAFGLRVTGTPRATARRAAEDWLEHLGVAKLAGRRPAQLSGGQAQRVALARTLCPGPRLLLLDEPLAALDVGTRDDVRAALRRQLAAFPGPTLLVTHDAGEARALADRLVVLQDGRVVQDGSAAELARHPATPWIARALRPPGAPAG